MNRREFWIPVTVFVLVSSVFILLWWAVERGEGRAHAIEARVTAEQVRMRLESWVDSRTAVLEYLGEQWPDELAGDPAHFRTEAAGFIALYPGFQAINWMDKDWVIRTTVPNAGNEGALGKDLHRHPSAGVTGAIRRALETGTIARTPVIDLLQSGKGLATYRPIVDRDGRPAGFINGVFKVNTLVDACLAEPHLRARFRFDLLDAGGRLAYRHGPEPGPRTLAYRVDLPVRVVDRDWTLHLAPSVEALGPTGVSADELLAIAGVFLAAILAFLIRNGLLRQRALAESKARYQILVENQTDMVVKVDREWRFLFLSPSFTRTFETPEDELLGRSFMPYVHEDDRPATRAAMKNVFQPPYVTYFEHRARTREGWRWLGWAGSAVRDRNGEVLEIIGSGRDITDRRNLEDQLRQSQKLQAIGQLAGGVAHDFNNILQAILGRLGLVDTRLDPEDPNARDIEQIRAAALRAAALTRQLLAFGRKQVLQPKNLEVNAAVSDLLSLVRPMIGADVELVFKRGANLDPVHADPGQFEQILMNLCVNARDAMPNGGTLTLRTGMAVFDETFRAANAWAKPGRWVLLGVADTGVGMSPEVRDRVFEPFFTTKGVGKGTGLGLATVHGIVHQHGGWIRVDSEPGLGTEFRLFFPPASTRTEDGEKATTPPSELDAPAAREDEALPGSRGDETLLVADDEPMVLSFAATVLEEAGYAVLSAEDGIRATALAAEHAERIDLVILDMVMPGPGGEAIVIELRERRPELPVLLTSGYSEEVLGRSKEAFAGLELLQKPYTADELLKRVRSLLDAGKTSGSRRGSPS